MPLSLAKSPPEETNSEGNLRRVGVEIEFGGLPLAEAAQIIADTAGLRQSAISDYEIALEGDPAGAWRIERDQELLKKMGRERAENEEEVGLLATAAEKALELGSKAIVPLELVSPPLSFERLPEFQELVDALRAAGAVGTGGNVLFAFALQLNPELPALDAETIRRYLQSFACLQDWLEERCNMDAARKVTHYSALYPIDYVKLLLSEDYAPDIATLIDDYLQHNPTRNRALDMLPVFSYIDEVRVRGIVSDPKIKSRPTFHYRLPNSKIDEKTWTVFEAWNDWVTVEEIAESPVRLAELSKLRSRGLQELFGDLLSSSADDVDRWLKENR